MVMELRGGGESFSTHRAGEWRYLRSFGCPDCSCLPSANRDRLGKWVARAPAVEEMSFLAGET